MVVLKYSESFSRIDSWGVRNIMNEEALGGWGALGGQCDQPIGLWWEGVIVVLEMLIEWERPGDDHGMASSVSAVLIFLAQLFQIGLVRLLINVALGWLNLSELNLLMCTLLIGGTSHARWQELHILCILKGRKMGCCFLSLFLLYVRLWYLLEASFSSLCFCLPCMRCECPEKCLLNYQFWNWL